jgi:hypothetical protein
MLFAANASLHASDLEATLAGMARSLRHDRCALAAPPPAGAARGAFGGVLEGNALARAPDGAQLVVGAAAGAALGKKARTPSGAPRQPSVLRQLSHRFSSTGWLSAVRGSSSAASAGSPAGATLEAGTAAPVRASAALSDLLLQQKAEPGAGGPPAGLAVGGIAGTLSSKEGASVTKAVLIVQHQGEAGIGPDGESAKRSFAQKIASCVCGSPEDPPACPSLDTDDLAEALGMLKLVRSPS